MRLAQRSTRGDARYSPAFEYRCGCGHHLGAEHALAACPVISLGSPCTGDLMRVGKGSRSERVSA